MQDVQPGGAEQIGRYRVETPIGAGGFARVVRALDESLHDSVAIKVLAENWAEDAEIRERFLEEARLLRRVRSDYLVTVHDIGELADGRPYFVMEFADAGTLAARLGARRAPGLDVASARTIVETLSGGLGALHAAGVIHRDVNPKNLLIRRAASAEGERASRPTQIRSGLLAPDERLILGDLGLAKDVVRSGSGAVSVVGGTAHYIPAEQADPNGMVGPATDVYAATGVLWECLTGTPPPDPTNLERSLAVLDGEWTQFFTVGLANAADDRYQSMAEWRDAALGSLRDGGTVAGSISSRAHLPLEQNPYMGLAAFQPEDADRFFGRNDLVSELVERLRHQRMLVVAGPSGSGKSSLVRAGLVPAVARGALPDSERWPVALLTPGVDPLSELAYQLSKLNVSATQRSGAVVSATDLETDPNSGRMLAETVTGATGGLLLVIDQFEELFTQGPGRDGQQAFLDALAALVDASDSKARIVAAIRADFYGTSASFPWLADKITDNQVLVGPMSRAELAQAIEEPARLNGLAIEDGLVDAILDEAGADPGALPLVSHALAETWRRRRGSTLTLEGYRSAGGVSGAIAQTANSLYEERFDDAERDAVRRLMLRLVSAGEGTPDTRRTLPLEAVLANAGGDPVMATVTEKLTEARLLTVSEDSIEIAHEALIRTWPQLRHWIEESRDDLRTRQHIGRAAAEWMDQGRTPDLLYRGTALQAALEWAETHGDVLDPQDQEFLDSSRRAFEAALAEQEQAAARSRRIRRIAVSALSALTLVAVITTVIAVRALRATNAQFTQSLAAQSSALVEENPRLALALAVEAIARGQNASVEARTTLVDAARVLAANPLGPAASGSTVGDALSLAIRDDGAVIALGYRDGSIQLWDPMAGTPLGEPVRGHEGAVNDMAFTPGGSLLVTAGDDETLRRWNVSDPSEVPSSSIIGGHEGIVWRLAVSPDGDRVASASEDGTVREWDIGTGSQVGAPFAAMTRDFLTVAYSPDGTTLIAGNGRGEVLGWNIATRALSIETFNAHGSDVWEIQFHPTGEMFATSSSDGSVRVWRRDGQLIAEPYAGGATGSEPGLAYGGDGTLFLGTNEGHVGAWTPEDGMLAETTLGHGAQVTDIVVVQSGQQVVSLATDQTFRIWTAAATPLSQPLAGLEAAASAVSMGEDGTVAVAGRGGHVLLFRHGEAIGSELAGGPFGEVTEMAIDASSARVVGATASGTWWLADVDGGSLLGPIDTGQGTIGAIAIGDEVVFTGGGDGSVKLWDMNGVLVRTIPDVHAGGVTALTRSAATVVSADRSGVVRLLDAATGDLQAPPLVADDNTIWGVDVSDDGSLLATASADEVVTIWEIGSRQPVAVLTPHGESVTDVAFVDDFTVVSLALDGSVRVWDVGGRQLGGTMTEHTDEAWQLAAGSEQGTFVTSSRDGTALLWSVLDIEAACANAAAAFDAEQQRRYLDDADAAIGCRTDRGS